jgi:hypothetical protein
MNTYSRHVGAMLQKRYAMALLAAIGILVFSSCSMTTKIITVHDCNTIDNDPTNKRTSWTLLWGLMPQKPINPKCDSAFNHLNKVEMKTNLGFILLSAVTLGAVVPQRVTWCCAPPNPPTEDLGKNTPK